MPVRVRTPRYSILLLVVGAGLLAGCSPSLYPLYRDYRIEPHDDLVDTRIESALASAGWTLTPGPAPNVIATNQREIRNWGLYKTVVYMEAVEIGGGYVRILVHPYRHYLWGRRSKIAFLNGSIRRAVIRDFDDAMARQAMVAVGSGVSRDRDKTR